MLILSMFHTPFNSKFRPDDNTKDNNLLSAKFCPFLCSEYIMKIGQDFWDIQYVHNKDKERKYSFNELTLNKACDIAALVKQSLTNREAAKIILVIRPLRGGKGG